MSSRPGTRSRRLVGLCFVVLLTAGACAGQSTKQSDDGPDKPPATTRADNGSDGASRLIPPASVEGSTTTSPSNGSAQVAVVPAKKGSAVAMPGAYAVGALHEVFVDRSRKTQRNAGAPEKPVRTLPTLVLYPAHGSPGFEMSTDDATPQSGPWPVVVFSHGVTGKGADYATTLRVLASAGYVVVAPDYPLSKRDAEGGPTVKDVPEQTRDVAFLVDRVLAASKRTGGPLAGLIDPGRIGLAGHSLGAITSLGAGYNSCCLDRRIKAVAEWAGLFFPLEGKEVAPGAKGRPLLIVHGDADHTVDYAEGEKAYRLLGAPKYFVTLPGAGHVPSYIQGVGTPQSTVVTLSTIDFFDQYLKGDRGGIVRLHKVVADAGPNAATEQERVG